MELSKPNFSSENFTGVHDTVMNALLKANTGAVPSYGADVYTQQTTDLFKTHFGDEIEVFFTFNGTGANNFGLGCVVERFHSVFCADEAHLYVNESTAPEAFLGCRLYPVKTVDGKICIDDLQNHINKADGFHFPQPKVVSITQPTECGTVYSVDEMVAIKKVCLKNNMLLHVDGARFFNAAARLGLSLKNISADVGVDILTLGGTKNGMMFGEAVIFFNPLESSSFKYHLKRSMQMASKNRFIAVQFAALLNDYLWHDIASYANALAGLFQTLLLEKCGINAIYPVQSNAVFIQLPTSLQEALKEYAGFYIWDETKNICRFMFSFDNTANEIEFLVRHLQYLMDDMPVEGGLAVKR